MYVEHRKFHAPENEDAKIWRYLDFAKFISLLDKKALFFAHPSSYNDPFEGSYPSTPEQILLRKLDPEGYLKRIGIDPSQIKLEEYPDFVDYLHMCSFSLSEYESAALWNIYSNGPKGIAIQSTFKRLKKSIKNDPERRISIGQINYIDYSKDSFTAGNSLVPYLHKRKSFEYENELRAISLSTNKTDIYQTETGIYVPIDCEQFIENVYVAPNAPPWFNELVQSMLNKFEINRTVKKSDLDADPLF